MTVRLTSIMSAAALSPECLARTLCLLSSMDMVRDTITSSSPSTFLKTVLRTNGKRNSHLM